MTILIVKNISREGPGLLEHLLRENKLEYTIVDLSNGERFPDPRGYAAVCVFGGPDSANDQTPKMQEELQRIKETVDAGIPYFGACLGMQALVKAMGGEVYANHVKEIGWKDADGHCYRIDLCDDPLFTGLLSPIKIFQLHGETVRLVGETVHPVQRMRAIATGKHCVNQAVRIGECAYGIRGHIELTVRMHEQWLTEDPELKRMDKRRLRMDYAAVQGEYELNGWRILTNFLRIAKIIG